MRNSLILTAALVALLNANGATRAEDDDEHENEGGGAVVVRRDVTCSISVPGGAPIGAGTMAALTVTVKNRSRRMSQRVDLSVYANAASGTPLHTESFQIGPHRRKVRRISVAVPLSAGTLVAVAACDDDQNPGNNIASVPVTGGDPPPVIVDPAVLAGAATYSTNCASCHGADARGTRSGPSVLHEDADEIYEAMREGEDGMPVFLGLTRTDASNMSKFLADPSAATQPPAPPAPEPGVTPTYAGSVKALLDASCVVCHTGANAPKNVRLNTYANASANAAAALAAMQAGTMPPGNPATAANIQLLADWIAGGKPQ
jgi:mono/diheme cytochrome c family protein